VATQHQGGPTCTTCPRSRWQEHIAALIREREGYLRIEAFARAAEVDAELERWGHKAKAPAQRATKLKKDRTEL
jgi:hypothetical protein